MEHLQKTSLVISRGMSGLQESCLPLVLWFKLVGHPLLFAILIAIHPVLLCQKGTSCRQMSLNVAFLVAKCCFPGRILMLSYSHL